MTTAEYRKKARSILKKRYSEGFFVVMIFLTAFILIKIWDIAQTGVILYIQNGNAGKLFFSTDAGEAAMKIISAAISFAILTPLITGGLWWFYQTACGNDNMNILKLYTGFKLNLRAGFLYAVIWIMGLISLIPTGVCWAAAYYIFNTAYEYTNQAAALFAALQLFMLGLFLLGLYLRCITSMILSPFIFIRHPDMNIFKIINSSRKIIYGSKLECLKLILTYLPAMLPVVTIPFILPRAVMALSVMACEKIGETDWER